MTWPPLEGVLINMSQNPQGLTIFPCHLGAPPWRCRPVSLCAVALTQTSHAAPFVPKEGMKGSLKTGNVLFSPKLQQQVETRQRVCGVQSHMEGQDCVCVCVCVCVGRLCPLGLTTEAEPRAGLEGEFSPSKILPFSNSGPCACVML